MTTKSQLQQQQHMLRYATSGHDSTSSIATTKGRMPAGIVKKERQRRRQAMSDNSKQKAFAAALAANLLSDLYSGQHQNPWTSMQHQYQHSKLSVDSASSSAMNERRSLEGSDRCSFRTMLAEDEDMNDNYDYFGLGSTEDLAVGSGGGSIKFDDVDCISVNRAPNMRGVFQNFSTAAADLIGPETDENPRDSMTFEPISFSTRMSLSSVKQRNGGLVANAQLLGPSSSANTISTSCTGFEFNDSDLSEKVIMPFSVIPPREKRRGSRLIISSEAVNNQDLVVDDDDDDDMSIITDISVIPTYSPSDVMRQQQKIRAHTLFARLIKSKTLAAKKTVRQLKRSCRGVVESTFTESDGYRPTKCVRVGEAF